MSAPLRVVGLVPAAGHSQRMGRPKLTLPLGPLSIIQTVVHALDAGGAEAVVVVAGPVLQPGAVVLANHARVEGAHVVHTEHETPDMRTTVEFGLEAMLGDDLDTDAILLTPGDCPGLTPALVRAILTRLREHPDHIVVPTHQGRRGHPVAIPWPFASEIPMLPSGTGVNALLDRHADLILELPTENARILADIDTPEQYERWTK